MAGQASWLALVSGLAGQSWPDWTSGLAWLSWLAGPGWHDLQPPAPLDVNCEVVGASVELPWEVNFHDFVFQAQTIPRELFRSVFGPYIACPPGGHQGDALRYWKASENWLGALVSWFLVVPMALEALLCGIAIYCLGLLQDVSRKPLGLELKIEASQGGPGQETTRAGHRIV